MQRPVSDSESIGPRDVIDTVEDLLKPSEEVKQRRKGAMVAIVIVLFFIGVALAKQVLIPYLQENKITHQE